MSLWVNTGIILDNIRLNISSGCLEVKENPDKGLVICRWYSNSLGPVECYFSSKEIKYAQGITLEAMAKYAIKMLKAN